MSIYDTLNPEQKEAVEHVDGPLLILAGAGSGKTRVLTHRAAYLIEHCDVNPWNIMAITFTNKAAGEMKERIDNLVGFGAESIWVATFHSSCARILRRFADRISHPDSDMRYDTHFTIYDADDSKAVMRNVLKAHRLESDRLKLRDFLNAVSSAKDELITPDEYAMYAGDNPERTRIAKAYREYQKVLLNDNAMDFDDLLLQTVRLFRQDVDVLNDYQRRFKYIMVDEYQDTNTAQFELIRLLASGRHNLCVVGDDDQSIYKFRGANIRNILDFESVFPEAKVIKLEQNYRSTSVILDAANSVIQNNIGRRAKALWTDKEGGEAIHLKVLDTAYDEAAFIAGDVARRARTGSSFNDFAVLYRTNAQSRLLEEAFVQANIPYDVVGGVNFYARREIKDLLAYLKTIDNGRDELSVTRIINVPKRGIGATTVGKVSAYAASHGMSFYDALSYGDGIVAGKAAEKLRGFVTLIRVFRSLREELSVSKLLQKIIDQISYEDYLREISDKNAESEDELTDRLRNVDELISKAVSYEEQAEHPTLSGFLEEVALIADIDRVDESASRVLLMTLHGAKGLEFDTVYLAGMEDGLFPSFAATASFDDHNEEMEEERRLAYVGITRAKRVLTLTAARARMTRGETRYNDLSRFAKEIDRSLIDDPPKVKRRIDDYLYSGGETVGEDDEASFGRISRSPARKKRPAKANGREALAYLQKGAPKETEIDYREGDKVRHIKFGEGRVVSIEPADGDHRVTVMFDNGDQRIMHASFAKLKKA